MATELNSSDSAEASAATTTLLGAAPEHGGPPSFAQVPPWTFRLAGLRPQDAELFWDAGCEIADNLSKKFGVSNVVAFDPMTIMAIISIIMEAIKFYKECKAKPARMIADAKENRLFSGSRLRRWKLQRIVASKIEDEQIRVEELRDKPVDAILAFAARQTEVSVQGWYAAVN